MPEKKSLIVVSIVVLCKKALPNSNFDGSTFLISCMVGEWDMVDALLYSTTGPIPVEQQPSDEEVSHGIIPIIILSVCVINIIHFYSLEKVHFNTFVLVETWTE